MVSSTERTEGKEPRHAALVCSIFLAELAHEPSFLEKCPDVEVSDDGRRRGCAVSRLDRVEGEKESTPEVERVTNQAVPLPGEERSASSLRLHFSSPMPFPLPQADELLHIPRRPQGQRCPEELHPVKQIADPSVEAVERSVR